MQPAILAHDEMVVGAGEQDLAGGGPVPLDNERHAPARLFGEPLSQARGKCRVDVLDDDDRGLECRGEMGEDLGQGIGTTGRGSQDNQGLERHLGAGRSLQLEDDRDRHVAPIARSLRRLAEQLADDLDLVQEQRRRRRFAPEDPSVGVSIASSAP